MKRISTFVLSFIMIMLLVPTLLVSAEGSSTDHKYEMARSMLAKLSDGENLVEAYDLFATCIENQNESVNISSLNIPLDDGQLIVNAVYADHPEYFWFDGGHSYSNYYGGTTIVQICPSYYDYSKSTISTMKAELDDAIHDATLGITDYMTSYEKELYLHNYLIDLLEYGTIEGEEDQSAYSGLVGHTTVCSGYSKAFQLLLHEVGIESMFVSGVANNGSVTEDHAWNLVKLGSTYTWVDLTWDDAFSGAFVYEYFNVDDVNFTDHAAFSYSNSQYRYHKYLPECTSDAYSKYTVDGNVVDMSTVTVNDVAKMLNNPLIDETNGAGAMFEVKNGTPSEFINWFANNFGDIEAASGQNLSNSFGNIYRGQTAYLFFDSPYETGTIFGNLDTDYSFNQAVTITLKNSSGTTVFKKTYKGFDKNYAIYGLTPGTYTLTASKKCNATRSYTVKVKADEITTRDVTLNLIGDINGNRHVTSVDAGKLINHFAGKSSLTGYYLTTADINADKKVDNRDLSFILRNILGTQEITGTAPTVGTSTCKPTISGPSTTPTTQRGGSIRIPVSISNNTGLMGYKITINFDSSKLTPTTNCVERNTGIFKVSGDSFISNVSSDSITVMYSGVKNVTNNGVLFYLNFNVSKDISAAISSISLSMTCDTDSTFDASWNTVTPTIKNLKVSLTSTSYTGLAKKDDGTYWYVVKGQIATDKTGLIKMPDTSTYKPSTYVYIKDGVFQSSYTGLLSYDGKYKYVSNGVFTSSTGFVKMPSGSAAYANTYVYLTSGTLDTSKTGLYKNGSYYWYLKNGIFQSSYTGLLSSDGKYKYVSNGVFQSSYTGLVKVDKKYKYVSKGILSTKTGLVKMPDGSNAKAGKTVYLKDGVFQSSYTGLVKVDKKYKYVSKGILSTKTGLVKMPKGSNAKAGKTVYLKKGVFQSSYTGLVKKTKDGKTTYQYVVKGILSTKTGLVKMPEGSNAKAEKTVYLKKGVFQSSYTGLVKVDKKYKYVVKGIFTTKSGKVKMPKGSDYYANKTVTLKKGVKQ